MNNENLKPFEPGKSGNPNGRKKGSKNLKTILKKYLDLECEQKDDEGNKLSYYEAMALNQIKEAAKGDLHAFKEIADRVEGKPSQSIDVTERKPDDLESMSEVELKEAGKDLIEKLQGKIDSRDNTTQGD